MTNQEIAKILREIGIYLEMDNVPFKPRAYEKAAETIDALGEEVKEIYKKGGLKALEQIPGVGVSIAETMEQLLKTGRAQHHEQLKKKIPVKLDELAKVEGLGPKTIKTLYQKLKIKDLKDLKKSAQAGKISRLEGFGAKSEENILKGIEFLEKFGQRIPLGYAMPEVRLIEEKIRRFKFADKVAVCGSIRRRKETIGDIDILAVSKKPREVIDFFVSLPEVARVFARGDTKGAVKLKNGLDADLRVVPEESCGAALNYSTGSKEHNIALRELAIKKGWKLSEYGLFKGKTQIAGKTEEEIYAKFGMDYIEPELREMAGELEAAKNHALPKLIGYNDLQGDLQIQTNWTDGANSIEEMANAAMEAGLQYIAITDHTKRLAMARGLDERRIQKQWQAIDEVNRKLKVKSLKFKVLKGTECDILKDGSMDLPDSILAKCDVVGASVHSLFNLPLKEQTERIKRAMANPHVDIIFHPTGRILNKRPPYQVDMEELIRQAKKTGTILEIDAEPSRLDLKDEYIRKCVAAGVKMSIDSDAHAVNQMEVLEYGIAQARRGWAERSDIINTYSLEKMLSFLKDKKK